MISLNRALSLPLNSFTVIALLCVPCAAQSPEVVPTTFRPPSVPLVAHDPYFSIWSAADKLTDTDTRHWTGKPHTISALIRVDGETFRLMGSQLSAVAALPQTRVQVLPTRTVYDFASKKIAVTMTFTTPALPEDLPVLSRPVTYITYSVRSFDGAAHTVQVYTDAGSELAVNLPSQAVVWNRVTTPGLTTLRIGSQEQPVLAKRGDDLRIDWGYLYLSAPEGKETQSAFAPRVTAQETWTRTGTLPRTDDARQPRPPSDGEPVAAIGFDFGKVSVKPVSRFVMLAYDDEQSVTFMEQPLEAYWRKNGMTMTRLLPMASAQYDALAKRCAAFDTELMRDLRRVGGEKYAQIAALAYRQSFAANKIVFDDNGAPLMFSKENFSNGCMGTVDILYPSAPQLLLFSPTLTKASLAPILAYSGSSRWKFPFAPHDIGTYPRGDGQVYGGGERTEDNQMPVEETGNLLILLAAVARHDGNARFCDPYWSTIKKWAAYLEAKGFDPESQLSTDDFAGHLAHNVNLSAKAIEALGSYALLCRMRGDTAEGARVRKVAQTMAARWETEARDGDHYRLAFDKPNTWSQKYNLAWDRVLGLNLFPASVMQTETAFYKKQTNRYGLPLDNRETYTKLDWTVWSATLSGSRSDFETITTPVYDFLNATTDRNPMSDWYRTKEARQVGFQARSVVGGVFLPMLTDAKLWRKWAGRDPINTSGKPLVWAALPKPPTITSIVPTSESAGLTWRYTFAPPVAGWENAAFDDSAWQEGAGAFGRTGTSGAETRTVWNTPDIWIRRTATLPQDFSPTGVALRVAHDEDAEIYLNAVLACKSAGYNTSYQSYPIRPVALATLTPGKPVTIAVHCRQTVGGQGIDVGIVRITPAVRKTRK